MKKIIISYDETNVNEAITVSPEGNWTLDEAVNILVAVLQQVMPMAEKYPEKPFTDGGGSDGN